jgi:hypothetical protein
MGLHVFAQGQASYLRLEISLEKCVLKRGCVLAMRLTYGLYCTWVAYVNLLYIASLLPQSNILCLTSDWP